MSFIKSQFSGRSVRLKKRKVAGSIPALATTRSPSSTGYFVSVFRYKSRNPTRRWGQYGAKSIVAALARLLRSLTYIVERVERRCGVVELVIEEICVRVGRDRNGRIPILARPGPLSGPLSSMLHVFASKLFTLCCTSNTN
jgi:hypothetical protein